MPETFTHYSYMACPVGDANDPKWSREPTGLYDLDALDVISRRTFIHQMMRNGELLAKLPFPEIRDMKQLRGALKWRDENGN